MQSTSSKLGLPYQMRRNSWQIYVSHCNQFVRRRHFYCDINSGCIQSTLPPSLSRENRINTVQSRNSKINFIFYFTSRCDKKVCHFTWSRSSTYCFAMFIRTRVFNFPVFTKKGNQEKS